MASDKEKPFKVTPMAGRRPANTDRDIKTVRRELMNLLRNSPGGYGDGKTSRGGARGRGATAGGASSKAQGVNPARHLQRASVRMTFAANKGDGQWKAHGRYIARESASMESKLEHEAGELSPELHEQELEHERIERSDGLRNGPSFGAGRLRALRQSYLRAVAERPQAASLNSVRTLSGIGVVRIGNGPEMLLPGTAPAQLDDRGSKRDDALRRPSNGNDRARPGKERRANVNGAPGFGSGGSAVPIAETLDAWQKGGDERMFKFILSPEFGDKMDLRAYTKDFVKRLESDLGTGLQWVAADHYNTEHPHVHLSVRGVDDKGHSLRIDPAYVKKTLRERAQQVATNHLGFRTDKDITEALTRQIEQQRYTELDRMILKSSKRTDQGFDADYDGQIPQGPAKAMQREFRLQQIKRLVYLEQMGLAERTGNMTWRLPLNVEHALRQRQIGSDRLKTLFQHRAVLSDPRLQMHNTDIRKAGRVSGRLIGTGLDEVTDKPYMLLEGIDGRVHYMYQSKEAAQARAKGMKVGEFVTLSATPFKGLDGRERVKVRFEHFGDAEKLLLDKRHLAGEVYRAVKGTGQLPSVRPYGGWLGRYHRALNQTGAELLERGVIRRTPQGVEIAQKREQQQTVKRSKTLSR